MGDIDCTEGRDQTAADPVTAQREALPLALSGIFWTRKLSMIGFCHGTGRDPDDRQGNGACRREVAGLLSTATRVIIPAKIRNKCREGGRPHLLPIPLTP